MRVLVVGGGGREHAIVWKLVRHGHETFSAPGNAGIARLARCEDIRPLDSDGLVRFARRENVDLTIVGPEEPLVAGLADRFQSLGIPVFGPGSAGARLEGDKVFARELMLECGIPSPFFQTFDNYNLAVRYVRGCRFPLVIKAAGLAAGKGVVVAKSLEQAGVVLKEMMVEARFGAAGQRVVIEEHLEGEEASVIGVCDGERVAFLSPSQDHKRLLDGDEGPNTGGMGAYAPVPVMTAERRREVEEKVFAPLLSGLKRRGIEYRGAIYAGLMITPGGVKVLEFNCRLGDPEAQVVLPLLKDDFAGIALSCSEGRLATDTVKQAERWALCVVVAAPGYPGSYRKGITVSCDVIDSEQVLVFHAGTAVAEGRIVSTGGRVLGVTGIGQTLRQARDRAYAALEGVAFEGMHFRRDIGARGLAHLRI